MAKIPLLRSTDPGAAAREQATPSSLTAFPFFRGVGAQCVSPRGHFAGADTEGKTGRDSARELPWRTATLFILLLSLFSFTACKPSPLKDLGQVPAFQLMNTKGQEIQWQDFRGEPVLVFFGYTYCPDYCPMTMHKVDRAYSAAGSPGDWPRLIFISVDPKRDTGEKLESYMKGFSFPSVALTGSEKELRKAAKQFGVTFYEDPKNPEIMQHSPVLFVIDEHARIRYLFKFSQTDQELQEIIDALT